MRRLSFLCVCLFMMGVSMMSAQSISVNGTVVSAEDGEPIIGASIVVKGTTQGTISDMDGKFTLDVPSNNPTLTVSYIGLKAIDVQAKDGMVIELSTETSELDEVMVVAYGTTTRSQFVGSAKAVDGGDLAAKATSNVTNALQGKVAGVQVVNGSGQPGTGAAIRVRGVGSINGGTTPLYVVDGSPTDASTINSISSHDIENITVLKDAASTAIYGARGANGVVLITTKSGSADNKITVNVDAKWGNNSLAVPNYDVMTDPGMYYETSYKALYNSQIYAGLSSAEAFAYADNNFYGTSGVGYQIFTIPDGQKMIGTNFKLNPNAKLGYSDGDFYYTPDNWVNETMKQGNLRQEYNVSAQGGDAKAKYFMSAGYLDDPGLVNGSSFERYTLRAKVDLQAQKWLKIGLSAAYARTNVEAPSLQDDWGSSANVFATAYNIAPIFPFYVRDADGKVKKDNNGYQIYDLGQGSTNQSRPGGAPMGNYAINLLLNESMSATDNFTGNLYLTLTPVKGLSLTARVSPEIYNSYSSSLSNPFYGSVASQGSVSKGADRLMLINQQYMANYKTEFAGIHKLEVLAGWEMFSLKQQSFSGWNDILYSPFVGELDNAFGVQPASSRLGSSTENFATAGAFGRVQYDLLDRYFINATVRHEGSSRFAPENRWGTFGSVGAAWIISRENWMSSTENWLDELKIKASYGTQGNDQIGTYYAYRDLYTISYNSETEKFSKVLRSKGNSDLTWEAQQLINAGVEFSVLDDVLSGSIEYFNRTNSDMLFNVPMPNSVGFSSQPQNIGSLSINGAEIDLNANIINNRNVKWSVFANMTYIDTKILELPDYTKETGGLKYSSSIYKEGGSLSQGFMPRYAGVDQATGKALYYVDPDNEASADKTTWATTTEYEQAKQSDLGDLAVKFYGGFGTRVEAYGFDISADFAYQLGGQSYDGSYQQFMHTGKQIGRNWHVDILDAWTPENPSATIPRISSSDDHDQKTSDRWLVSNNYLSLNNVTIGYNLPKKALDKMHLSKLRFFLSGDNLALFSARQGWDPRQSQNSLGRGVGISTSSGNYVYSSMRVLSGGISLAF